MVNWNPPNSNPQLQHQPYQEPGGRNALGVEPWVTTPAIHPPAHPLSSLSSPEAPNPSLETPQSPESPKRNTGESTRFSFLRPESRLQLDKMSVCLTKKTNQQLTET